MNIDSIVILGGPELERRIRQGVATAKQHPSASVLLSGTPQETMSMRRMVQDQLGDGWLIIEDGTSWSTVDNAVWTRGICEERHFMHLAVVTSEWHMPRTQAIFRWAFSQSPTQIIFIPAKSFDPRIRTWRLLELGKWALFCASSRNDKESAP
ncbi:YdcF family protein [Sulfobacillus sp. hq2]|uniref:YdcF family protein n=1 Tax=Sulfobacillus TaxID=28033 RepID=UPI000CD25DBB|nr:YdcF family protein [Sulfobacillus sp. hq2]POB09363.1 hypothetical protein CO251_14030 [Sulfobacillus sp. hq2]